MFQRSSHRLSLDRNSQKFLYIDKIYKIYSLSVLAFQVKGLRLFFSGYYTHESYTPVKFSTLLGRAKKRFSLRSFFLSLPRFPPFSALRVPFVTYRVAPLWAAFSKKKHTVDWDIHLGLTQERFELQNIHGFVRRGRCPFRLLRAGLNLKVQFPLVYRG